MTLEEKKLRAEKRKQDKYNKEHTIINGIVHKWCKYGEHWEIMSLDYFYKNDKNSGDWFHNNCKKHEIEKAIKWEINHPERCNERNQKAYAENRWGVKDKIRESTSTRRSNGKYNDWLNNTEAGKRSKKLSKELAREKEHEMYDEEWESTKKHFNHCCAYCNMKIEDHYNKFRGKLRWEDFQKEHVIHRGRNDIKNCVPSCENCNNLKYDKTLNEWYNPSNPNYTYERYLKICNWLRHDYKKYILPKRSKPYQRLETRLKEVLHNKNKYLPMNH